VAVGRDHERLVSLAAEHGDRVSPHVVDLTDPDAVDTFADELPERHPRLSVVINNAGVQTLTDFFGEEPHIATARPSQEYAPSPAHSATSARTPHRTSA
jgi:uncharacterized oxidoreductase